MTKFQLVLAGAFAGWYWTFDKKKNLASNGKPSPSLIDDTNPQHMHKTQNIFPRLVLISSPLPPLPPGHSGFWLPNHCHPPHGQHPLHHLSIILDIIDIIIIPINTITWAQWLLAP